MGFSWEWDRGPIGDTTTDGAAIGFAGRAEGAITRTPATIRGVHQKVDTHRITAQRITANRLITAGGHRTRAAGLMVAVVANHPAGMAVEVADPNRSMLVET